MPEKARAVGETRMKTSHRPLARLLMLAALTCISSAGAEAPPGKPAPRRGGRSAVMDDAATREAQLKRRFEALARQLVIVAGRMEASDRLEDQAKSKALRAAAKLIRDRGVESKFDALIRNLTTPGASRDTDLLAQVVKDNKELRDDLNAIIELLTRTNVNELRQRREKAEELLDRLKDLRSRQARLQALTERGRHTARELKKHQEKLTKETAKLLDLEARPNPLADLRASDSEVADKVREKVERANDHQRQGQRNLGGNMARAAADAGEAVEELDGAIRELEAHLKQLRKEEREQLLAALRDLCARMLLLQGEVRDGTQALERAIHREKGRSPTVAHVRRANDLADKEERIQVEAKRAQKLLESSATGVAFVEGFQQIHKDAGTITTRLSRTDVGDVTQAVEADVIATLKDMLAALRKALQSNNEPPTDGPSPDDNNPRPKPRLVEYLSELKMVAALQRRVNARTTLYGKRYRDEQLAPPGKDATGRERQTHRLIQGELKELAVRQARIREVARKIKPPEKTAAAP
jgi:hypothetical protein